jgi:hypothetical protein
MTESGKFQSAHEAVTFAYHYSAQQYDAPPMNRMASPAIGSGAGMRGTDGAGQAGMVKAEAMALGRLYEALIIARYAPRDLPCSCGMACCSGARQNFEWANATDFIAGYSANVLGSTRSNARLRMAIVRKHFGVKAKLMEIADACGVHRDTASDQNAKIITWLRGQPARNGQSEKPGEEDKAWKALGDRLMAAGMIDTGEMVA